MDSANSCGVRRNGNGSRPESQVPFEKKKKKSLRNLGANSRNLRRFYARAGFFQQLAKGSLLYLYSEPVCHLPQFAAVHLAYIHGGSRLDFPDLVSLSRLRERACEKKGHRNAIILH